MRRRTLHSLLTLGALSIASTLTGCQSTAPRPALLSIPDSHMIFNPQWTPDGSFAVARADWPAAYSADYAQEELKYREIITDGMGQLGRNQDYYFRRIYAVRTTKILR